jgi:uncharacterized protein DUF5666
MTNKVTSLVLLLIVGVAISFAQQPAAARQTGTVKSISGSTLKLKADSGPDVSVTVEEGARILRVAPGQTDLKSAEPMNLPDIQVGDRVLVRGKAGDAPDSFTATSIIVMKAGEVAQKQQKEMQDWQRRGASGIVTAIDPANHALTVSTSPAQSVTVKTDDKTSFLRYAPDSIRFADAEKSSFEQIQKGDQLRARGARSADGKELAAEQVISGTFRNIAGTISSIDAAANSITVKDILAKKTVTVKLTSESQLRKLPAQLAQRIAFFLKSPEAAQQIGASPQGGAPGGNGNPGQGGGHPGGPGFGGRPGGGQPDFQQMINRLPAVTLSDLQKEEAVMIVSTSGRGSEVSAITLLSGVEPILTAPNTAGAAALLNGWNLSTPGEGGPQ